MSLKSSLGSALLGQLLHICTVCLKESSRGYRPAVCAACAMSNRIRL